MQQLADSKAELEARLRYKASSSPGGMATRGKLPTAKLRAVLMEVGRIKGAHAAPQQQGDDRKRHGDGKSQAKNNAGPSRHRRPSVSRLPPLRVYRREPGASRRPHPCPSLLKAITVSTVWRKRQCRQRAG